jgi:putative nucleotidyltransferase with HDIG domain
VAATIEPAVLFALDDEDALPVDTTACLLSQDRLLACSPSAPRDVALAVQQGVTDEVIASTAGDQLVRQWTATLAPQYAGPAWTVVLMRPGAIVFAPVTTFVRNFILMGLSMGAIVTLVSLGQVRRNLRPLDTLIAATVRLSQRDFDNPIQVASHDEFETLATAFNSLSTTLKRQFSELEAFSLGSLAALARAIDAKSPWTSGHSERVTAVAVAIGAELGLPREEMSHLERGGLVHDIGKLATPPEILDKPGRLTPEEQAIMERHPMQGVRILEPIPAFAPLLPIVAEHHERWDGKGYPRGLAGEAIARTARVLAVADVYDALRSDRPYRDGLPHRRVIDIIVSGAGSQFDPAAVEAFLTIASTVHQLAGYREPDDSPDAPPHDLTVVPAGRA